MRIVALEEHYSFEAIAKRIPADLVVARGFPHPDAPPARPQIDALLDEFGEKRLGSMDASGISMQVLSTSGPGTELLPPAEAVPLAQENNDRLAAEIAKQPKRYGGFAHLPMCAPDKAAQELDRCVNKLGFHGVMVNGMVGGKFLDDPSFAPVLSQCEALGVPLYIHPGIPPASVREAYFSNLPGAASGIMSRAGYGWHAEVAIHVLRMCVSGALDRHPKLQLIVGHQGEGLPAMLTRFEEQYGGMVPKFLQRNPVQMMQEQLNITIAGFYSVPAFTMLLQTFGIDRLMFSVVYPYSRNEWARAFLDKIELSPADREKFAHGNADRLLKLKA